MMELKWTPIIICVTIGITHTTYVSVLPKSGISVMPGRNFKNKYNYWDQFPVEQTGETFHR